MEGSSLKANENGAVNSPSNTSSKGRKQEIDWGKYGLAETSSYEPRKLNGGNDASRDGSSPEVKELFDEEGEVR